MQNPHESLKTFGEHLGELRKVLTRPLLILVAVAGVAFWQHEHIIPLLQKPLDKTLYYSSPMGGFSFILQVALVCGLLATIPLFIYGIIKFLEPLIKKITKKRILLYLLSSVILASIGVFCGYMISLPAALHFLSGFETSALKPLISANEYMRFVLTYLAGFALMFQLPLIITIINRIKPLKPKQLMKHQKKVIAGSFIAAAILTPTPDMLNQLIFAAPMILLYQISIVLVGVLNFKRKKPAPEIVEKLQPSMAHPIGAVYAPAVNAVEEVIETVEDWLTENVHPIGAVYAPEAVIADEAPIKQTNRRPIDVILSGQLAF